MYRERTEDYLFVRLWRCTGVSFLSVCMCTIAETGCSTGIKGNDAVCQLRNDNDEDDGDDVTVALVAPGLW